MNIINAIKMRSSIRKYEDSVSDETNKFVSDYIKEHNEEKGPFGYTVNLFMLKNDPLFTSATFGIIEGNPGYIAGSGENVTRGIIDFGYLFEKMIIKFAQNNIATCWLSKTYKSKVFVSQVDIDALQVIPAITPYGRYMNTSLDELINKNIDRKQWDELFFIKDFNNPIKKEESNIFEIPLEMVRIGPSSSNIQPWRLVISEDYSKCHFYIDETKSHNRSHRFPVQMLDIGIAMCHLEIALNYLGIIGEWVFEEYKIELPKESMRYITTFIIKTNASD